MIKVVAGMTIAPDKIDAAMDIVNELIAATVKEAGCIGYNFCKATDSEDAYAFIESWQDQAALDAHMASEHFGRLLPALGAYSTGEPQIAVYSVLV